MQPGERMTATFRLMMARNRALILAFALPILSVAQDPIPVDDAVMERLDALSTLPWLKNDPFTTDREVLNVHHFAVTDTPSYAPDVVRQRLAVLDERTPFKLTYNVPVQSYIDLYANRRREQTARMMGLAQLYFPVFEEALDRHGLPQELKYLAVVESALFPGARSRAAAVGLWQFMVGTGKMYGLEVDSYIDERCDVYQSTEAACRYLKDLHRIFGNWELALAAYNCGPGNVNKAVRRAGGTMDYWAIYAQLPRETRGYVPAFIAVNYIFEHAAEHNIYPVIPNYCAYEVDTVQVCYPLTLDKLAEITGGSAQELRDLNPTYKQGIVPDLEGTATIYLPQSMVAEFIEREDFIRYSYAPDMSSPAPVAQAEPAKRAAPVSAGKRVHVVRKGESLGLIAQRNRVSLRELRAWNNLRSDRVRPGQKLIVRRGDGEDATSADAAPSSGTAEKQHANAEAYIYHTVQPGDTLWGIAQRYPGTSIEDLKRMNADMNLRKLAVGKKIKVGVQKS